jgi:hypothetical protein
MAVSVVGVVVAMMIITMLRADSNHYLGVSGRSHWTYCKQCDQTENKSYQASFHV